MSNSKSERTRSKILDASWDLIAKEGAAVSMARIASEIGMTRQSIYVHFGTRGKLLMALVKRADARFEIWESLDAAMLIEAPRERLDEFLASWLTFVEKIYPVAKHLISLRLMDTEANEAWNDRMADLLEGIRSLVKGLEKQGALRTSWTRRQAADYLWASCSVQSWALLVHDRKWSVSTTSRVIRSTLAHALLTEGMPQELL